MHLSSDRSLIGSRLKLDTHALGDQVRWKQDDLLPGFSTIKDLGIFPVALPNLHLA